MENKGTEVLKSFLTEEHERSEEHILEKIRNSKDLAALHLYTYTEYSEPIRNAAKIRISENTADILSEITDIGLIVTMYVETYWISKQKQLFLARTRELIALYGTIDSLPWDVFKKLSITSHTVEIIIPFRERLVFLLQSDNRRTSFEFLLRQWYRVSHTSKQAEDVAKYMPEALKQEDNIRNLLNWTQPSTEKITAFNCWNHNDNQPSQMIWQRIIELLPKKIASATDKESLSFYYWIADVHLKDGIQYKTNARIRYSELVLADIQVLDMKGVLEYRATVGRRISVARIIAARMHELVPAVLSSLNSPADVFPLISELEFVYKELPEINLPLQHFEELLPAFCKSNTDLSTVLQWYQTVKSQTLHDHILDLLKVESNPEVIILVSEKDTDLVAAAKERLSEIILALKTPSNFFH